MVMENVIKQGYLKKGNSDANWISGFFKRNDQQKWFVFLVREGVPYLEYYDSDVEVFSQKPINSYSLSLCRSIRTNGQSNPMAFNIICSDRFIELVASSRNQMREWVNAIEFGLTRLAIIKKEADGNVYSVLPAVCRQPRVSDEVQEERDSPVAQAASSPAILSQVTGASSFEHSAADRDLTSEPTGSTHQTDDFSLVPEESAPPIPRRPPPSIPKSNSEVAASSDLLSTTQSGSFDSLSGNDSNDFVSWEVVMRIKEERDGMLRSHSNGETKTSDNNPPEIEPHSYSCDAAFVSSEGSASNDRNHSSSARFGLHRQSGLDIVSGDSDLSDSENLINLNDVSDFSFGTNSLTSGLMQRNNLEQDNEYSLLPGGAYNGVDSKDEKKCPPPVPPIPLPRRATQNNSNNPFVSQTARPTSLGTSSDGGLTIKTVSGVEWASFNGPKADSSPGSTRKDGCRDSSTLLLRPVKQKSFDKSKKVQTRESGPENLYSPVLNRDKNIPSSFPAPQIPPLPISSSSAKTGQHQSNPENIYRTDVSSLPSPLASKAASFDQFSNPPVPFPRHKPLTSNKSEECVDSNSAHSDIPPIPPRRISPKLSRPRHSDNPPCVPLRNSHQSFVIKRPQSFNFAHLGEESSSSINPATRALPTLPTDADESRTGASGSGDSKRGGLSHKMLLDRAHSLHTVVSLKQTQVEILQNEIDMAHVEVSLTQKSGHGLALVDWNGMPCIAGWNQKNFPTLHGKLHIGDMILSVNNIPAASPEVTQKLLRQPVTAKIEVLIKRMPYAKVFAIRRNAEGQSLGLKREGGTAEILYVDPNGLAAQHGLMPHAPGGFGGARCSWFLTEINSRPLNLFFKENEIEHRLCAVGREISIVVQPSDFIFEIRKQLKKLKNYKSYIVQ